MSRWRRSPTGREAANSSADTLKQALDPPAEQPGGEHAVGPAMPEFTRPSVFETAVGGKETTMSPSGAPDKSSVSLAGSLAAFTLADVLTLLASTSQTGELHAVSEDIEGWLWLSDGQLANARVGAATTIGQAVFDLARITDGEFSFISGVVSSSGHPTVPVAAVLEEVRPQVDEWHELQAIVPLEALVNLAPNPPTQEIRIRNDQWGVLTAVGTSGLSVKSVLDRIGGEQITGLRTLRDLESAGLIAVDRPGGPDGRGGGPGPGGIEHPTSGTVADPASVGSPDTVGESSSAPESPTGAPGQSPGLAEVTQMPPPITVDPWAPPSEAEGTGGNGVA